MVNSTVEAHMLRSSKYKARLRKFNEVNDVDAMSEKMYTNARDCLYQIEVHEIGLGVIENEYKKRRFWISKEVKELIEYVRNAYPKNWFQKRAQKNYADLQKQKVEKPKWQFDLDFNQVSTKENSLI